MKNGLIAGSVLALLGGAAFLAAQDTAGDAPQGAMQMPAPQKEHEWLEQFVGDWDAEVELFVQPGEPPQKAVGSERVRSIGGFWILTEYRGAFMDQPFQGCLTLGYDPQRKKYIGTWIDSAGSHLWQYEGAVDAAGKTLTLEAEGPCHESPGELSRFRHVAEFNSRDRRTYTAFIQGDDGEWARMMRINYRRK